MNGNGLGMVSAEIKNEIKFKEMKETQELLDRIEVEINKTPTGKLRNLLCDVNIVLHRALNIPVVVGSLLDKKLDNKENDDRSWLIDEKSVDV